MSTKSSTGIMVLRSGAALRQPQRQQQPARRARRSQIQPPADENKENHPPQLPLPPNDKMNDTTLSPSSITIDKKKDEPSQLSPPAIDDDDEEDEPLVFKRRRVIDPPLPASHSIVEVVGRSSPHPATPAITHAIQQKSMMHALWLSPPLRKEQTNPQKQQPLNCQRQQSTNIDQLMQPTPRTSSISPKTLASLPLNPATSASPPAPSNDVKGKARAFHSRHRSISPTPLPQERRSSSPSDPEDHKAYWRNPINRSIKKWAIKGNKLVRATTPSEAKSSGGIRKVYEEAANFVKEKRKLSNEAVNGLLARKRLEYMVKKVKDIQRQTTSTGSGTKGGKTLQQQRESMFLGYHELWDKMQHISKFNLTETQDNLPSLNLADTESARSEVSSPEAEDNAMLDDVDLLDEAESSISGSRLSKGSKIDVSTSLDTFIGQASSAMEAFNSDNQFSYYQTRIRELEARCDILQARCDTWQAKYDEMRDA